jgi:hypothetical protein
MSASRLHQMAAFLTQTRSEKLLRWIMHIKVSSFLIPDSFDTLASLFWLAERRRLRIRIAGSGRNIKLGTPPMALQ